MLHKLWRMFTHKDGKWSKTAFWLSLFTLIAAILWPFQSLMAGFVIYGWTVPAFDVQAAATMLFTVFTLYVANHKIKTKVNKDGVEVEREGEKPNA